MTGSRWERLAAAGGIAFVALIVASFLTPGTPDRGAVDAAIASELTDERTGILFGVYLGGLATIAFLAFAGGLWHALRRVEGEIAGASVLSLVGAVLTAAGILVANGAVLALVYAADEGRNAGVLRALLELGDAAFIPGGFALAVFLGGTALSAIPTGALPRWLGWPAAVLAAAYVVSLGGIFSEQDEGGALGAAFFVTLLMTFLWVLATSIVLLRREAAPGRARPPRVTAEITT
jgi:hypothetical protein